MLTTSEMETLYAFDRYDILISNSRMSELLRSDNGGKLDGQYRRRIQSSTWRTGQAGRQRARVRSSLSCPASRKGVVVSNVYRWRFGPQLDDEVADVIEAKATKIELPPSSRITAYRWGAASASSTEGEASTTSGASTAGGASTASRSPACAELAADFPAPTLSEARPRPADNTHASRAYSD